MSFGHTAADRGVCKPDLKRISRKCMLDRYPIFTREFARYPFTAEPADAAVLLAAEGGRLSCPPRYDR